MRKIVLFVCVWMAAGLVSAETVVPTGLKNAKIYINAGHGGWNEVNDRHIPTLAFPQYDSKGHWDTLGFWESSSNLKVAFDLREMLESRGATVMMSRLTNQSGTRDNGALNWDGTKSYTDDAYIGDRNLSMIAKEASQWEADVFVSIHSNAATVGKAVNYLLFFMPTDEYYKGSSWTFEHYRDPQDTILGRITWPYMHDNGLDVWVEGGVIGGSPTKARMPSTSEYTLLQWGNLTVPGFIVEASFHSYLPNTHRFLNRDYQYMEALRFFYGYCAYFQDTFPATCCLTGDVRCPDYKFNVDGYKQAADGSKDVYKPLNGVSVKLMKGGQEVASYTTDQYYNGIYCFKEVEPGDYQIAFHYADFRDTTLNVTAVRGKTICTNLLWNDPNFDPFGDKTLMPDYPTWVRKYEWKNTTEILAPTIVQDVARTIDGRDIRRMQVVGNKTYILTQNGQIFTHATETGKKGSTISVTGVKGGTKKLSDIFFGPDSMLVGCNEVELSQSDAEQKFKLYRWQTDGVDEPEVMFSCALEQARAGFAKATCASTMAFSGNSWHDFQIYYPAVDAAGNIRVVGIDYDSRAKGVVSGEIRTIKYMNTGLTTTDWGDNFRFMVSPFHDDAFIVEGPSMVPTEYGFDWNREDGANIEVYGSCQFIMTGTYGLSYINYGNRTLMLAPAATLPGLDLFDATDGMVAAKMMSTYTTEGASSTVDYMHTAFLFDKDSALMLYGYTKGVGINIYPIKNYETLGVETIRSINELVGVVDVYTTNGLLVYSGDVDGMTLTRGQVYIIRQGNRVMKLLY